MNILDSDSEWESYSDTSDSEDQDTAESVFGDHAQNILSSLDASIRKIDDFLSLDRVFVHGDYVSSVTDPSGRIGRVTDVNMTVDLESIYGESVKDVDSKKVLRFRSFYVGDYVIYGPWIGRIARVLDLVTVVLDDGSKCQINPGDSETLVPLSSGLIDDAPFPYYPGQRVRMRHSSLLKSARWLCGTWKGCREEGIVCHVDIESVYVSWIASVLIGCNIISSAPPLIQDPKNLTLLSCYPYASWQLGDWCKLPQDYFQNLQMPIQVSPGVVPQCTTKMQKFEMKHHAREPVYVIAKAKAMVDILWQDGSHSVGVDTCDLLPVNSVGDHDFWPEQIVLQTTTPDYGHSLNTQHFGIVRYVDAQERTVKIRWVLPEVFHFDDSNGEVEETLSAYELVEHPDFSYSLGDVVVRHMRPSEHFGETLSASQADGPRQLHDILPVNGRLSSDIHDNYASRYLSYIGNVVGFKDGGIEVKWASGLVSKVNPSEIFGLDKFDVIAGIPVHDDEVAEEDGGKESEDEKLSCHEKQEDLPENYMNFSDEDCKKNLWDAKAPFFPRAAVGFLANVATTLFGLRGSTSLSGTKTSGSFGDLNNDCDVDFKMPASKVMEEPERQIMHTEDVNETLRESSENQLAICMEIPATAVGSTKTEFKQFGIVDDYSDHHFFDGTNMGLGSTQAKRGWLKKVQQEWSILEKNLPDTIYVRVYEERMDLMRVSIVGAPGTPYHDALFFFDICFPPDYPHEPPNFEQFVVDHFTHRAHQILRACKAYMDGIQVGCASGHGQGASERHRNNSMGFKIMLEKLVPVLVSGFSEIGVDCSQFLDCARETESPRVCFDWSDVRLPHHANYFAIRDPTSDQSNTGAR
ncbi:hypothetical protein Taro_055286 [Colocasia esculenta]|uniref:UBC core domain-containing protein n=1 Tax=Colocasia esculenta TaxID=4460 RepID=A0A843XSH2_COLES|nr:hypothetical protein [Colocasia esculenta]